MTMGLTPGSQWSPPGRGGNSFQDFGSELVQPSAFRPNPADVVEPVVPSAGRLPPPKGPPPLEGELVEPGRTFASAGG